MDIKQGEELYLINKKEGQNFIPAPNGASLSIHLSGQNSVHTRLCGCNCLRCVCQLIYHDFKVFNLLLGLTSCNKYPFTFFIRWDNVSFVNTYIL